MQLYIYRNTVSAVLTRYVNEESPNLRFSIDVNPHLPVMFMAIHFEIE